LTQGRGRGCQHPPDPTQSRRRTSSPRILASNPRVIFRPEEACHKEKRGSAVRWIPSRFDKLHRHHHIWEAGQAIKHSADRIPRPHKSKIFSLLLPLPQIHHPSRDDLPSGELSPSPLNLNRTPITAFISSCTQPAPLPATLTLFSLQGRGWFGLLGTLVFICGRERVAVSSSSISCVPKDRCLFEPSRQRRNCTLRSIRRGTDLHLQGHLEQGKGEFSVPECGFLMVDSASPFLLILGGPDLRLRPKRGASGYFPSYCDIIFLIWPHLRSQVPCLNTICVRPTSPHAPSSLRPRAPHPSSSWFRAVVSQLLLAMGGRLPSTRSPLVSLTVSDAVVTTAASHTPLARAPSLLWSTTST